ncbi:MAG: acyl-CoA dehydrogenase, partial [Desulfobacterales bacterium]|nr:acyl-CoA dehydrogenase [Desulfobacterales bacterium]
GKRDGDFVLINGEKSYAVNAPIADWIAVLGVMDGESAIFLVNRDAEGLVIKEPVSVLGYAGTAISGLELNNCRVPADQALGPFKGKTALDAVRMWEDQVLMGASLGMMSSSFQSAKAYSNEHATGGKPIIAYQSVAFKLSEMLTLLQTSQLFAYRSVWTMEAEKKKDRSLIDCAKVFCTESAEKVASTALQILAGKGLVAGNSAERAYRCAKYGQIAGTSAEIGRVKIGDAAFGRPL